MEVRKFWLINGLGNRYDFTIKTKEYFLSSPTGLGFNKTISTIRLGDEEIVSSEQNDMPTPSGNILFYGKRQQAYQDYEDFIDFIKYTPLRLYYLPPNLLNAYYVDVKILSVEKGEYSTNGYLECPINFYALGLWQNSQETIMSVSNVETGDGKFYELERPYYYNGSSLANIELTNNGTEPIGFVFEIKGSVTNPRLTATKDGITYGVIKLDGTFTYVKINSNDSKEDIYLEKDGVTLANPYSYQDLSIADGQSQITFFKLPVGTSQLAFTCDKISSFKGSVDFLWKDKRVSI